MPIKRRQQKRRLELTEDEAAWLCGTEGGSIDYFELPGNLVQLWAEHADEMVADWVAEHPGSRPLRWWQFSAPEPRQRLGGIGTPSHEVLAYGLSLHRGVPRHWVSEWQSEYFNGQARNIHGKPIGDNHRNGDFAGVAIDPKFPPLFESQATYLERHGLFLPGERRRLKPKDFEPEKITDIFDFGGAGEP